jgi:hypothetical protein
MVQGNQVGPKLNGTHQLTICADDEYLLGDNIDTIKKNTETLIDASEEVGLLVGAGKIKYMMLSHQQNAREDHYMKKANRSFENVVQFKHLGKAVTNQYFIQEEIKRRLNSSNACCHSVQNPMSSHMLSTNLKVRIYQIIILTVVLYGCKTWSLMLREECRLRVFESRVLRRILVPRR